MRPIRCYLVPLRKYPGNMQQARGWVTVTATVTNRSRVPAFFIRAEVNGSPTGDEILPSSGTTIT
jgi:hypothetical protein